MAFPGTQSLVEAAEADLGRRLPDPHRQRLLRANGGEIRADRRIWTLYPVWDPTDRRTMGRTANHIVRGNQTLLREWPDMLAPDHVAIADNGGGDLLILRPGSDEILSWDHETSESRPVTVTWDP